MKKTVFFPLCLSMLFFTATSPALAQDPADPHAAHAAQSSAPPPIVAPAPADPHAGHVLAPAQDIVQAPAPKTSKPAKSAKKPLKASKRKPAAKPAIKEAVSAPAKQEPGCGMMKMTKPKAAPAEPGAATPAAGMKHDMKMMKSKMAPAEPGSATPTAGMKHDMKMMKCKTAPAEPGATTPVSDPKTATPATLPPAHVH